MNRGHIIFDVLDQDHNSNKKKSRISPIVVNERDGGEEDGWRRNSDNM